MALEQPHTPSLASIVEQCMKWELHQLDLLDRVDTAVGGGNKLQLTTVSVLYTSKRIKFKAVEVELGMRLSK